MEGNLLLVDWVSISSKELEVSDFQALLGMENCNWIECKGMHGYRDRLMYEHISIHYNGRKDMGVWMEMSGQGCRAFETVGTGDYESLFDLVRTGKGKLTRLDLAFDDHSGICDLDEMSMHLDLLRYKAADGIHNMSNGFVSKCQKWEVISGYDGKTINHGSRSSNIFIRIYDKAMERNCEPGTHWVRVEMQLRDDRAKKFIEINKPIGDRFAGVLYNYLRYVDPDPADTNVWRWPMTSYWEELVGEAAKITLYEKPGMEYNLDRLDANVFRRMGNAIDAAVQIYGVDDFLYKLRNVPRKQNPKYKMLIEEYGQRWSDQMYQL